jgi:putative membrane protein
MHMLQPTLKKNDKKGKIIIWTLSIVVFAAVAVLSRVKLDLNLSFNVHVFATFNAIVNSLVTLLLIAGLVSVKQKNYILHKKIMTTAIILSSLFLVSYICHHLLAGETKFGDTDHNGLVSDAEKLQVGGVRTFYYIILGTHIPLAGIILPFILFTAYRALIAEWPQHKKIARITWPIWLYVSITGVLVYWLISPYYF